jgi:hypothetical protein
LPQSLARFATAHVKEDCPMAPNSRRWLAYAFCCLFIAACGGNDDVIATAPTLTQIADQTITQDTSTSALAFTVADPDTSTSALTVSGSSSNITLVPNANIVFGGSGASRTVTVTPAAGQTGTAVITYNVNDGSSTASHSFTLTVNAGSASTFGSPDAGATLAAAVTSFFAKAGTPPSTKRATIAKTAIPICDSGSADFTGDDSTAFVGDGTIVFDHCSNTDQSNETIVEDGQFVYKCTDAAQDQSTCNSEDFDATLGLVDAPLALDITQNTENASGDFYGVTVSSTDDNSDATETISMDGRMVVSSSDCGAGDFTVATVAPLVLVLADQSVTGGELDLTSNTDDSQANIVFHQDKSATVTVNGVAQDYTQAQLEAACSGV